MENTPIGMANALLQYLGSAARPAALLGALAIVMLAGGLSGMLYRLPGDSPSQRVVGFLTAAAFFGGTILYAFPPSQDVISLVCLGTFALLLTVISWTPSPRPGRDRFLLRTGAIVGGAALLLSMFAVQSLLGAIGPRRLFWYRRPTGLRLAGLTELVTPPERFYVMDKVLQYPEAGPPGWRLTVDGAVDRALRLNFGDLLAWPRQDRYVTMECVDNPVGGPLIGTALWSGVSVAALLREAGALGDTVVFHSEDRYAESVPRAELEQADALLAYGMNGATLSRAHGYPARLILPGVYGFKSVKWLRRIEIVPGSYAGTWGSHGWSESAVIRTTTRIDLAHRQGNQVRLAGIAFAGRRGIRAVEVRAGDGPWQRTAIGPVLSSQTWVQWTILLRSSDTATFWARAIDGRGVVQTADRRGAYPSGATGWASVTI